MNYTFFKYQGAGNDFIIFDCIHNSEPEFSQQTIEKLCDRKFGIGADGLLYISQSKIANFKMVYFNSDGHMSSMCGNGGRCIAHLAHELGHVNSEMIFEAADGIHEAKILDNQMVALGMNDIENIRIFDHDNYELNTGSPHYVKFVHRDEMKNIVSTGKSIRFNDTYKTSGINVNLVATHEHFIEVATYERGVEDETLSCGTGVTAAAIASNLRGNLSNPVHVKTKGGNLKVDFIKENDNKFHNVVLTGPADLVFKGKINI